MREILFRGKRIDNGEWIEGDLTRIKDGDRVHTYIYGIGEVDPETVGQCTGLSDKNGRQIFEGDILRYNEKTETGGRREETLTGIYEMKFECRVFYPLDILFCHRLEIVGNIHDNPELLKNKGD